MSGRRRCLWWRRLRLGLPTVLGLGRQGFFIPCRYAGAVPPAGTRPPYPAAEALFAAAEPSFAALLSAIDGYGEALRRIGSAPAPAPRWDQDWFPRLDAAAAYALVRERRPGRILEVGAGHSTRFFARAAADAGLATAITAIDPAPRAELDGLGASVLAKTVQEADPACFRALAAGDMLSIDSSHILMPGTDVDMLLNRVLPALPAGVLVHVHDVFLPDDYPPEWAWRGYNEQLGVAALLLGGGWRALWASHYLATRMAGALAATVIGRLPLSPEARESSLWLEKR